MVRYWLKEGQFERIESLLPGKHSDPGRTAGNNRLFVEAVLWIARTGAPWRDLPPEFGLWNSAYQRFSRWSRQGIWHRVFAQLAGDADFESVAAAHRALIDQLIVVASGLLGVMVVLFGIGAVIRVRVRLREARLSLDLFNDPALDLPRIGAPAVPDGSPSSELRATSSGPAGSPSRKALQWCRASWCRRRARSTTARADSSSSTRSTRRCHSTRRD